MKTRHIFGIRQLILLLLFGILIISTVSAQPTMTAANGDTYILTIRDPGHPVSADEIRQWTGKSGTTSSLTRNSGVSAMNFVSQAKSDDTTKVVAYGYYQDKTGAGHEFEYDILGNNPGQIFDAASVNTAADAWVNEVIGTQKTMETVTDTQNDDWPVILTKTRHSEMQPYGKLTNVWELRKKAVSSSGKSDFAIRTHAIVEPGIHAWPQSSKWTLDDTKQFLDVTQDWSVCPNLTMNSFEPANGVTGRTAKNISVQLLPSPAFSYPFIKPELTLVESEISLSNKIGVWHMDLYAHSPAKTPDKITLGIMPGSSAKINTPGPGEMVNLVEIGITGHFINADSTNHFNFGLEDMIHYSGV